MKLNTVFRRYHRQLAILMFLPLTLTVITGAAYPIFDEWFSLHQVSKVMLQIHSGRILGLQAIYPLLNGLGVMGLLITGLNMTGLLRNHSANKATNKDLVQQ
ncbi:MAG: peptidase [Symploca sp. SIO1B1]|nr:peptidase [Symploca sp. SIO1A3]NER93211.1 peptidase [Symploca sp. SIO1B1]